VAPREKGDDIASKSELKKLASAHGELNDDDANPELFGMGSAEETGPKKKELQLPKGKKRPEQKKRA
jgi:hypothetical protein